jgi:hypothetical protein
MFLSLYLHIFKKYSFATYLTSSIYIVLGFACRNVKIVAPYCLFVVKSRLCCLMHVQNICNRTRI